MPGEVEGDTEQCPLPLERACGRGAVKPCQEE